MHKLISLFLLLLVFNCAEATADSAATERSATGGRTAEPRLYKNENKLDIRCLAFESADRADVIGWLNKTNQINMDRGELWEYFAISGCCNNSNVCNLDNPKSISPVFHLIADDAPGKRMYPKLIYYYLKQNNQLDQWDKIVNSLNNVGESILDYIVHVDSRIRTNSPTSETLDHLHFIRKFICDHGGVYVKYKNTMNCQMSLEDIDLAIRHSKDYLERYPSGDFINEAKEKLSAIRKEEAERPRR